MPVDVYKRQEPTTLTGSIGIFGMFPNAKGLTDKIGVNFDVVKTNKSVSYTHLYIQPDYVCPFAVRVPAGLSLADFLGSMITRTIGSVSYTHLDVYKRQLLTYFYFNCLF